MLSVYLVCTCNLCVVCVYVFSVYACGYVVFVCSVMCTNSVCDYSRTIILLII